MASRADLEHQLAELEQAFQSQQIDEESYQRSRTHLVQLLEQVRQPVASGGSDFFATGGGAPPTASGVRLNQGLGAAPAGDPMQKGKVIRERYQVEGLIGEGGMGMVYRVHDILRERPLAMKLLHPHFPPEAQKQLAAEISMQERIRHKGVVRTFDLDIDPTTGRFFYTMEFVDGPSLEEQLEEAKQQGIVPPLDPAQVFDLLERLCHVLEVAHQEGIVHRDLKPQNILLPKRGGIKLLDFGIAKDLADQSQHTGFTGTPIYMAPEQLRGGGHVTAAADVYSVGVILYQLLTGQLFYGRMPGPMEWLSDQGIALPFPAAVDEVVFKALDFSPERRYQSVRELFDDFQRATSGSGAVVHGVIGKSPARSKSWAEAAAVTDQTPEDDYEEEIEEPMSSPSRRSIQIKGRAPVSGRRSESGISISHSDRGQKKKKKFGLLKILMLVFVVLPLGVSVLGVVVVAVIGKRSKTVTSPVDTPNPATQPPKIDLAQVDQAFRETSIPSSYGDLKTSYQRNKAWMYEFERAVNEIYGGADMVWLHATRVANKSIIRAYLNTNKLFGYQPYADTLLFRIVQDNPVALDLTALRALQAKLKAQAATAGGNWLDNQAVKDSVDKAKSAMATAQIPLRYHIEDGEGWVYKRESLPTTAPFYGLASSSYLPSYYTMTSRQASIMGYRTTYRNSSAYRTRQTQFAAFVTAVQVQRSAYYRSTAYRIRSRLHRARYRSGSRYRSSSRSGYRSRGGKW